ncbi:MAG: Tat (twin-arginine translocation) pathway signal sequence containing protein [Cyclobacteriaceae bacterium]
MNNDLKSPRREFLGKLAAGAGTALTIPAFLSSIDVEAAVEPTVPVLEADEWFKKVKGKHRIIYDATEPHNGFPIIWSWVYYKTNNATGTPDADMTAMVVLRHNGICLAMEDRLWEKYKFGEMFKVNDESGMAATKNIYNVPTSQMWTTMGIDGIKAMTARGAMFCVCDVALTVYSGFAAKTMNANPEDVKKDWLSGLLPGVQVVPSGVWAVGRAQENKCAYCYAGG